MKPDDIKAIIRVGLAGIPSVGGVLAQAWSEWDNREKQKRIEAAINLFGQKIASHVPPIDPHNVTSSQMQFLVETIKRVEDEIRENKRQRFVSLLGSFWNGEIPNYELAAEMLTAVERLSDTHLHILVFLLSHNDYPSFNEVADALFPAGPSEEEKSSVLCALNMLAADFAFIRRSWTLGQRGTGSVFRTTNFSAEGIARNCYHEITDKGKSFLRWIEAPS